jgi:hypothetical protein
MAAKKDENKAPEAPVLESPPDPDGSNYVYKDVDHETVVGYQEQVYKSEA